MSYELDWQVLERSTTPQTKYAFDEVKHLFRKVAFDVYKPLNGSDKLWELRDDPEGKFLYALYDEAEDLNVQSEKGPIGWEATADRDGLNVTLSFKNVPLVRFASERYNFASDEAELFAEFLKSKTSDKKFVNKLMNILPENKRQVLAGLNKGA